MMILAVDIGNTTIAFGLIYKGRVRERLKIETTLNKTAVKAVVGKILKDYPVSRAVVCSVVPHSLKIIERILRKSVPVDVIGRDIMVPLPNRYKNPKQVGQDRLVGAYGAMKIYGSPLIIVDLGTAITFDVLSKRGEYLGGAIVPGLRLSAESLFLKTALLPKIDIKAPKHILGRTTQESMLSGLFYGYGSLCRGFIELISRQMKCSPKVVMTGGHTRLMKKFISSDIRIIDEDLVFKGIYFLSCLSC